MTTATIGDRVNVRSGCNLCWATGTILEVDPLSRTAEVELDYPAGIRTIHLSDLSSNDQAQQWACVLALHGPRG